MSFGKRRGGGDFLPLLKYDARVGRFYCENRVQSNDGWSKEQTDVTERLRMVVDLAGAQVGWLRFPRGAPPETMLVSIGTDIGTPPSDDYKQGFRILVKMDPDLGGDVRELMSTAAGAWNAFSALHDAYLIEADRRPGQLPIVVLAGVVEQHFANGTSFEPQLRIAGWVRRPEELPEQRPPTKQPTPTPRTADDMDDEIPF